MNAVSLETKLVQAPDLEPVSLEVMKNYLKANYGTLTVEDTEVEAMIRAATRYAQNYCSLSFLDQQRKLSFNGQLCELEIPYGPVKTVDLVERLDGSGLSTALVLNQDYSLWGMDHKTIKVGGSWITGVIYEQAVGQNIEVTYTAGYDVATGTDEERRAAIPPEAIQAIKKQVATDYYYRENHDESGLKALSNDAKSYLRPLLRNVL